MVPYGYYPYGSPTSLFAVAPVANGICASLSMGYGSRNVISCYILSHRRSTERCRASSLRCIFRSSTSTYAYFYEHRSLFVQDEKEGILRYRFLRFISRPVKYSSSFERNSLANSSETAKVSDRDPSVVAPFVRSFPVVQVGRRRASAPFPFTACPSNGRVEQTS